MRKNKIQSNKKKSNIDDKSMIEIDISTEPERPSRNEFLNTKKKRVKEQEDEEIFDINIITNYKNITPKEDDRGDQLINENNVPNNFDNFSNFKNISREKYALQDHEKFHTHDLKHEQEYMLSILKNRKSNFNSLNFQHRMGENFAIKRNPLEPRINNKYSQFIKGKISIYLCLIFLIQ